MSNYPKAIKSGYIDLGFGKIPVAVLKDGTRLITTSGFHKALGKSRPSGPSGNRRANLPTFLQTLALKPFITNELTVALQPIEFTMPSGGKAIGYPATLLPQVCEIYLKARDADVLTDLKIKYAASADLIMRALAHTGIIALVDEATGFQEFRDKTALQAILDKYLSAEAAKWAKTFPDSFYLGIFKLKKWNTDNIMKYKPGVVAYYTKDLIYNRLTAGLLDALEEKNPITEKGFRKNKHHQFLTHEQGICHLKGHLFMVQKLMKMSKDWEDFMRKMNDLLPYAHTQDIELKEEIPS